MKSYLVMAALVVAAFGFGRLSTAQQKPMVYELRTYTTPEGKLDALNARFRDHTLKLFAKHGMKNVWYGVPMEGTKHTNTMVYLLAHKDRAQATKSWEDFRNDPDWLKARNASEVNGKLTEKVESVFFDPTDYSPMK